MKYFLLASLLFVTTACDQTANKTNKDPGTLPRDNTGVNDRDKNSTKTPIDQNENQTDIDQTANIRKRIVDTEKGTNAQNVKIITQDKKTTLRGPVDNAEEKKRIEDIAAEVAGGAGNVVSELEVKAPPVTNP